MIKLNVQFTDNIQPIGQAEVGRMITAIDSTLRPRDITVGIRITTSNAVREINKKYAGKDEATDVLSFNYQEGPNSPKDERAGDVLISWEHLVAQAEAAGTTNETELALLMMHGILHVLGYDHQDKKAQKALDDLQAKIMANAKLDYRDFNWKN